MNLEFCPFPSLSPEWHLSSRHIGWSVGFLDANGPPGCHSWLCLWHYYHLWSWKPVAPWLWWLSQSHVFILLRDWKIVGCAILETMGTVEDLSGGRGGAVLDTSGCHFYLFLFTMSTPEKWAQVPLLSDSQHLPGNSISHHDSFSTPSLGTSAISWDHSLLLSYLTSLFCLENYLTLHCPIW